MDIMKLSDNGLKSFHLSVQKVAEADAANPQKTDPYYGVAEYADWAQHRDEIEAELERRGIPFGPVEW
ncbi:hypothetical protein NKI51_25830 [Mesorhizobium australicum]|uniref:hypothetical protein n=1 Tax=Mesorhizobium TaxID=68287 RepID=UPI0003D05F6D|nr:hypothetical protein [Mesorhizobium sp. LNHC209A00]ESY89318.1 hypothetical protein X738_32345 [Mesorhizobium sp. LNHC209A00]